MSIIVYSKQKCEQCVTLKDMLNICDIKFEERKVGNLEQVRIEYEDYEEQFDLINSFPILVENGNNIMGFEEAMLKYGEPILDKRNNKYTR